MKWIALPAVLCMALCANAQVQWGFKAGAQLSTARYLRNDVKISSPTVTGFNAGILAKMYFDEKVAFVTGLVYSARGFKVKTLPGDTLKTYHLNYADIPLLFQLDLSNKRGEGFYCKLGPSLGIGVYGKEKYTGMNGMKINNRTMLGLTGNHLGLFDASVNAALGYSFHSFFAEAAYAYGIGNINNDPDGPNIKSRVASLNIGFFFR